VPRPRSPPLGAVRLGVWLLVHQDRAPGGGLSVRGHRDAGRSGLRMVHL